VQKNSLKYNQGDIVLLELPFTDLLGSKLRPVLVLNAVDLGEDLVVAKITSYPGLHRVPITQTDLLSGRLKKETKLYRLFKYLYCREETYSEDNR